MAGETAQIDAIRNSLHAKLTSFGQGSPVCTHTSMNAGGFLSNGTDTVETYRLTTVFPNYTTNIRAAWWNGYINSSNVDAGPGNSVTITAGLEYNGTTYQVTWNGATSVTVADKQWTPMCDPIPLDIPAGSTAYWRTCYTVTTGNKWCTGLTSNGDWFQIGSDVTTGTGSTGMTSSTSVAMGGPQLVTGVTIPAKPGIAIIGDSITYGYYNFPADNSWIITALGNGFGYAFCGKSGAKVQDWATQANVYNRVKAMACCDYAVIMLGINDVSNGTSLATLQGYYTTLVKYLTQRGVSVYGCTIGPNTTSTDGWRTTANQTIANAAKELVRTQYNDWIRTNAGGIITGYFETADQVETSRNSGIFKAATQAYITATASGTPTTTSWGSSVTLTASAWRGYVVTFLGDVTAALAGKSSYIQSNTTGTVTVTSNVPLPVAPAVGDTFVITDAYTGDGLHYGKLGHAALANAVNTGKFVFNNAAPLSPSRY